MHGITPIQAAVLRYVIQYRKGNGYSPSLREIADHFGWASTTAARCHVLALKTKGRIRVDPTIPRGIVPVEAE